VLSLVPPPSPAFSFYLFALPSLLRHLYLFSLSLLLHNSPLLLLFPLYFPYLFSPSPPLSLPLTLISLFLPSSGDYYATAAVCCVPPPPQHALSRGILVEGLGAVLCGFMGICHATTSYSDSMGFIAITGVRWVDRFIHLKISRRGFVSHF
jgi:xanthine/uracil permease